MVSGSCLCGAVRYTLEGDLRPSVACHCTQCRKTSGHYWSATQVPGDRITIEDTQGALRWFQSSATAKRGFCSLCGASLFWQHDNDGGAISVGTGTIDGPTGLITEKHIYTADKGDYYDIEAGVPQRED